MQKKLHFLLAGCSFFLILVRVKKKIVFVGQQSKRELPMQPLSLDLIHHAVSFLQGKIRKTPLEFSPDLSEKLKVPVFLKLEFLQKTGSFKLRGALFYLSTLSEQEKKRGVAACSAGNHGLGIAYAAREMGIACTIFVPDSVEQLKYEKLIQLGARVRRSPFDGYDDTLEWSVEEAAKEQLTLISGFNDERIMAGNGGSLAYEILEDLPDVRNVITPIGGGGLAAGLAFYLKEKRQQINVVGCQHKELASFQLSLEKRRVAEKLAPIKTVAGGIALGVGTKSFEILKDRVRDVALLSEEEIVDGFCWVLEHHQYLIEPTSSVVVSACLFDRLPRLSGPTVLVLTGRNVSFKTIHELIKRD